MRGHLSDWWSLVKARKSEKEMNQGAATGQSKSRPQLDFLKWAVYGRIFADLNNPKLHVQELVNIPPQVLEKVGLTEKNYFKEMLLNVIVQAIESQDLNTLILHLRFAFPQ